MRRLHLRIGIYADLSDLIIHPTSRQSGRRLGVAAVLFYSYFISTLALARTQVSGEMMGKIIAETLFCKEFFLSIKNVILES
jgi:hypothetical protein